MKVEKVPISEAIGHILVHNQAGPNGRKVLKKGRLVTEANIPTLQSLGREKVYVAILDKDDVGENEAAHRLGEVIRAEHIKTSTATTGRVNLTAKTSGLFKVNVEALLEFNTCSGITFGTIPNNSQVQAKRMLGTIKVIPYSIPKATLEAAEAIAANNPLVELKPFVVKRATLIITGSELAREKVISDFTSPLHDRLETYNTEMIEGPYVPEDEQKISEAIQSALDSGVEMVLIAGETSIMDTDDITPRAIRAVGGEIVHHGVPVEPGNLFLLAYYNEIPIVGAPGCARSRSYNVIDMVLPRLAAGERLSQRDLVALGHGGLLK